jgi:dihydrodipicolinate synthase/N-acetylneuraminate lyase
MSEGIECTDMSNSLSRRQLLATIGPAFLASRLSASEKPMRGVFIIMATPYTAAKAVDFEDLVGEVRFLDKCGAHGIVWPQLASEYSQLTTEERMRGMEALAAAAKGKRPALVLGVQGQNTEAALAYARYAEKLAPDALIAIPPTEAKTLDDFREYYRALARSTRRPLFIQTTGGPKGIIPTVSFLLDLAREFPNCGFVKEEYQPVISRMKELSSARPVVKSVFSGAGGRGMMYEMRLGFDGTMPGAPYADIHAQIWDLYQGGRREQARDLFSRLLLMLECEQQIPGTRQYLMKKRGVFKTTISRQREFGVDAKAAAEIDFNCESLRPYLRA